MKLGYVSSKSLDYAKRCGDHHKTWSILEIIYIAVADELLVPYVRHCKEAGIDISVRIIGYGHTVENPNYCFMQQMVFTFLHAIMLFRTGCRKETQMPSLHVETNFLFYFMHAIIPDTSESYLSIDI